jgi:hypothetical protein
MRQRRNEKTVPKGNVIVALLFLLLHSGVAVTQFACVQSGLIDNRTSSDSCVAVLLFLSFLLCAYTFFFSRFSVGRPNTSVLASTWNTASVPTSGDSIYIGSGFTVQSLAASYTFSNVTIGNGATLYVGGSTSSLTAESLTMEGDTSNLM